MDLNYYDKNAQLFFDDSVQINLDELYGTFLSYLGEDAHILDAGCGSGRDSKAFINRGYKVTSFDASVELVKLASVYIGQQVKLMSFNQLGETNTYDGVWCCASLLHIPLNKLAEPIILLKDALKKNGIMYLSFKYGKEERSIDGRHFTDMNEHNIKGIVCNIHELAIIKTWVTPDKRPGKKDKWFNVLLNKSSL